jgi:cytochrome c-type biogenesis protein CcmH/NrfF
LLLLLLVWGSPLLLLLLQGRFTVIASAKAEAQGGSQASELARFIVCVKGLNNSLINIHDMGSSWSGLDF